MKFLADANVERALVLALRNDGHDVTHIAEIAPHDLDDVILARAHSEGRLLLTNDKDFGELVFRLGRAGVGIILVRLGSERIADKVEVVPRIIAREGDGLLGHFTVIGRDGSGDARSFDRPEAAHGSTRTPFQNAT